MIHYSRKKRLIPNWLRTKSVRYWAGAKGNKPKHGTPKLKRGNPLWMCKGYSKRFQHNYIP